MLIYIDILVDSIVSICYYMSRNKFIKTLKLDKMKVLLIEDNSENIQGLTKALDGHEVILVTEVTDFLYDHDPGTNTWSNKCVDLSIYDAVITDVNLPAATDKGVMEGPIGILIAFKALQCGVKKIAVITDANHHEANPISKGLDLWDGRGGEHTKGNFMIGDIKMLMINDSKKYPKNFEKDFAWLFAE